MKNIIGIVFILFASIVQSADFQKGLDASNKGDFKTAYKEWSPLAEQGYASAQHNLGVMYANGWGVLQGYKQAVRWYRKAAEQGYAGAQYNMAVVYANGRGVLQDDKQAVHWYRKAAEQGYADAQYNLGIMYAMGQSVLQDNKQAYMWFNLARYNGADTKEVLSTLTPTMIPKSINEAQEMAKICLESNYTKCN
jgi:TPR repeat protein